MLILFLKLSQLGCSWLSHQFSDLCTFFLCKYVYKLNWKRIHTQSCMENINQFISLKKYSHLIVITTIKIPWNCISDIVAVDLQHYWPKLVIVNPCPLTLCPMGKHYSENNVSKRPQSWVGRDIRDHLM